MRINQENKTMDMESRDINYILPAYVRSYLFYTKNEMPERIIFPMFASIVVGGKEIPIEYVPPLDLAAIEIAQDSSNIAEVTPAQEAMIDEKDEEIKRLKEELEMMQAQSIQAIPKQPETPVEVPPISPIQVSPARVAFKADPKHQPLPSRQPKLPPGGDIGPGSDLSDMHSRDRRDQTRTAKDLVEESDIDDTAEKDFDKTISRDEQGRPIVEDKDE